MAANLEAVWTSTVSRWNDAAAHDELFRLVHLHDTWLWAARKYREYANAHTGDAVAARQLKKLQGFLMVALAPRDKPTANPYRRTISVMVMLLIALGVGSAFTRFAGGAAEHREVGWESGIAVAPEPAIAQGTDPMVETMDHAAPVVASTR